MQFRRGRTIVARHGNQEQVLRTMIILIKQYANAPAIKRIIYVTRNLGNYEFLKAIYRLVCENILFQRDNVENQTIRSAIRTLYKDKKGNCVDASVLFGTILLSAGIPFYIRRAKINSAKNYDHVYIVTWDGYVLDANQFWESEKNINESFDTETKSYIFDDTFMPKEFTF